jgi:hypothetical protein
MRKSVAIGVLRASRDIRGQKKAARRPLLKFKLLWL